MPDSLRILTYNIQVAIGTSRFREYLTQGWRHVLPYRGRLANLDRIAEVLSGYDLVALQEIDAGSYRGEFLNQAEYLARRAGFAWWHLQINRDYGALAQHGIAVLSRIAPTGLRQVRLPGMVPGRGALLVRFGEGADALTVVAAHLALRYGTQRRQLRFLGRLMDLYQNVVLMGDMNCTAARLQSHPSIGGRGLKVVTGAAASYPSWRPRRNLDHVVVSPHLQVRNARVLDHPMSDHLPVAVELLWPHRAPDGVSEIPPPLPR